MLKKMILLSFLCSYAGSLLSQENTQQQNQPQCEHKNFTKSFFLNLAGGSSIGIFTAFLCLVMDTCAVTMVHVLEPSNDSPLKLLCQIGAIGLCWARMCKTRNMFTEELAKYFCKKNIQSTQGVLATTAWVADWATYIYIYTALAKLKEQK